MNLVHHRQNDNTHKTLQSILSCNSTCRLIIVSEGNTTHAALSFIRTILNYGHISVPYFLSTMDVYQDETL